MQTLLSFALSLASSVHGAAPASDWKQPVIRTGVERVEALPWVATIEQALARAKAEKKLVLATVVAVTDERWVSGYAGAEQWSGRTKAPHMFGDEVGALLDDGLRKERVMMAAWFADPEIAALVEQHFVCVRLRCKPWDFDLDFPSDPLAPLGTKLDDVGAPALVVAKSDGTFVHALGRVGVFAPEVASATLRTALAKARVRGVAAAPAEKRAPIAADVVAFAEKCGIRLDEWTKGAPIAFDAQATTTETGAGKSTLDAVLGRAADVLLVLQGSGGGWADPAFDPRSQAEDQFNVEVARTGLVVDALLSLRARLPARKADLEAAARRGIDVVGRFADAPQPWIWQATYATHLQVALLRSDLEDAKPKARERAARLVTVLAGMQQQGGWSYMPAPRTHSFNTAIVLLHLAELRELGVAVSDRTFDDATEFLATLRNPADARDYWYADSMRFEPRAASCRSALCELALSAAGDASSTRRLAPAVEMFFELEPGARSVTKVYEVYLSPNSLQDAYHYYFGHYYAARALARLPKTKAASLAQKQLAILKRQVEADGSFVDAQAQGKSYSTAMAVLTILEDLRWTSP